MIESQAFRENSLVKMLFSFERPYSKSEARSPKIEGRNPFKRIIESDIRNRASDKVMFIENCIERRRSAKMRERKKRRSR